MFNPSHNMNLEFSLYYFRGVRYLFIFSQLVLTNAIGTYPEVSSAKRNIGNPRSVFSQSKILLRNSMEIERNFLYVFIFL